MNNVMGNTNFIIQSLNIYASTFKYKIKIYLLC